MPSSIQATFTYSSTCRVLGTVPSGPAEEWLLVSPPVHPDNFSWMPSVTVPIQTLEELGLYPGGKTGSIISESEGTWTVVDTEQSIGREERTSERKARTVNCVTRAGSEDTRVVSGGWKPRTEACSRQGSSTGSLEPAGPSRGSRGHWPEPWGQRAAVCDR